MCNRPEIAHPSQDVLSVTLLKICWTSSKHYTYKVEYFYICFYSCCLAGPQFSLVIDAWHQAVVMSVGNKQYNKKSQSFTPWLNFYKYKCNRFVFASGMGREYWSLLVNPILNKRATGKTLTKQSNTANFRKEMVFMAYLEFFFKSCFLGFFRFGFFL